MLYLKSEIENIGVWGIWRIDESIEDLLAMFHSKESLTDILSIKSQSRILEKLAVRVLLKELSGNEEYICYEESGKPYLKDRNYHISISHTKGYVAVILSERCSVGIDIEQITDKVRHVQSKYISNKEYIDPEQELIHLLLHWSAKEAIYKVLNIEGIELKEEVIVEQFIPEPEGVFQAIEKRQCRVLNVYYLVNSDFVLTYVMLDSQPLYK